MTGISRALERPEEADDILRDLKAAEKMDRKGSGMLHWHVGITG